MDRRVIDQILLELIEYIIEIEHFIYFYHLEPLILALIPFIALYTLPGGEPRIRLQIASLQTWIFEKAPRMWTFWSATTIRVLVAFSIANFVLPPWPAIRPIARERWSPFNGLTSVTSNDSTKRSSNRNKAIASGTSNPRIKAYEKQ